jgi:hypothetical protein
MEAAAQTYINRNLINVKDDDFKYTISPIRRSWVKSIYPIMDEIIKIPQAIPWSTYEFEGTIPLWLPAPENNENNENNKRIRFNHNTNSDVEYDISDKDITAKYPDGAVPFEFFGGSVYELLHNQFYKERALNVDVPHIRTFLDPTGDVDVHIARPKIFYPDTRVDPADSDYTDKTLTTINALIDNWTHWLFEKVAEAIEVSHIPVYFDPISEKITEFTNPEIAIAIESKHVGNILITRVKTNNMMKVQCSIKLKDSAIEDHFLEFVYTLNEGGEDVIKYKDYRTSLYLNNDIYVQPLRSLYEENYDSIANRLVLMSKPESQHKFYNHIQRLSYLNRIVPLMIPKFKPYVQNLTNEITNLCYILRVMSSPEKQLSAGLVREYETNFQTVIDTLMPAIEADPDILCKFVYTEKDKDCDYEQKLENVKTILGDILTDDVKNILLGYNLHPRKNNVEGIREFLYNDADDIWPAVAEPVAKPVAEPVAEPVAVVEPVAEPVALVEPEPKPESVAVVEPEHSGGYRKTHRRISRKRRITRRHRHRK